MAAQRWPGSAPESKPADHPERHAHATDTFGPHSRTVALLLDQVVLLTRGRGDVHHALAVYDLFLDLLGRAGLDLHRAFAPRVAGRPGRRGRRLGKRFELGRLLRRER